MDEPSESTPVIPELTPDMASNTKAKKCKHRAGRKKREKRRQRQEQPVFKLRSAGVKGLGLYAARNIQPGERIIEETPLFVVGLGDHMEEEIITRFMHLPPAGQNSYMRLYGHEISNVETEAGEAVISADLPDITASTDHETDVSRGTSLENAPVDGSAGGMQAYPLEDSENHYGGCESPKAASSTLGQSFDQNLGSDTSTQSDVTTASEPGSDMLSVDNDGKHARERDGIDETTVERIINIWRINSYALDDGFTLNTAGICLTAARLNHACVPNVYCAYNRMTGKMTVQSICPIAAGDELCASYIQGAYMIRQERQQELDKWRFECRCEACSEENELRRQELKALADQAKSIHESLPTPTQTQLTHAAEALLRMVELMSEDGLMNPELADVCFGAATCCAAIGRIHDARAMQENRLEILLRCFGVDSPVVLREVN